MAELAGQRVGLSQADDEALRLEHHALRQPLNALGLFCAALKMQPLTPAQQPLVAGIDEAAQLVERLVDQHFAALRGLGEPAEERVTQPPELPQSPRLPQSHSPDAQAVEPPRTSLAAQASSGAEARSEEDTGGAPSQGSPRPRRIVVVDDDDAARLGMVLLLEAWGASVQAFASIRELRAWTSESASTAPDLLMLDYHLPRPGDGLEALRLLRQAWPGRPLRALLITGDERAAVANALSDGSLECLVKPVTPGPLLAALRQQLGPQFGV